MHHTRKSSYYPIGGELECLDIDGQSLFLHIESFCRVQACQDVNLYTLGSGSSPYFHTHAHDQTPCKFYRT